MAFYFDSNPNSKSEEKLIRCEINGSIYNFYTDNNVFSKKYLDFGTRTLLEAIDINEITGDILDFGCGTGGEMVGLLQSIDSFLPQVTHINLVGIDGNLHALRLLEKIITEYQKRTRLVISLQIAPIHIGNFYDLSVLNEIIKDQFDLILSFKAICEFVTKDQFEGANPYSHIVNTYFPYTSNSGIIVLVDVTSYNNVSNEWLPMMMDKGLASINCKIINRNDGYNYTFSIKHSRTNECFDYSKVCWRIVKQ